MLTKVCLVKTMVFPVVMYGCESWTVKKAECQRIDAFELWCWRRLLKVPWTSRSSQSQFWRKSVLNIHWKNWCWNWNSKPLPPDEKNWLTGKGSSASKDWRQEEKGTTKDEMVGWHHQLDGHEFEQAPRVGEGQGSLVCWSPWGCKESDMTEWLDWKLILASQVMLVVKNPSANAGDIRDVDSIPGSGRSPGGGHSNPFQYSCLENPTDRRAWWATVYRVAKSRTWLKQQHTSESYHHSYVHIINLFFCLFVLLIF